MGANLLTHITPEYPIANRRVITLVDHRPVFDRQRADATRRVNLVRANRVRRTRVDATRARPAMIAHNLLRTRHAHIQRRHHPAKQQITPKRRIDHQRVLADPTDPRPLRVLTLQNRSGITKRPKRMTRVHTAQPIRQRVQPTLDHPMIIQPPRIPRHPPHPPVPPYPPIPFPTTFPRTQHINRITTIAIFRLIKKTRPPTGVTFAGGFTPRARRPSGINIRNHDDRAHARQHCVRIQPQLGRISQPLHLAVHPLSDPPAKVVRAFAPTRRRHTSASKAELLDRQTNDRIPVHRTRHRPGTAHMTTLRRGITARPIRSGIGLLKPPCPVGAVRHLVMSVSVIHGQQLAAAAPPANTEREDRPLAAPNQPNIVRAADSSSSSAETAKVSPPGKPARPRRD